MSIQILSNFSRPTPSADYYLVEDIDLKGGYRVVADNTARDAIVTTQRKQGMLVYVLASSTMYTLIGGISNVNWTLSSIAGGASIYWKDSVRVASTAQITPTGTPTVDGVTLVVGDRILLKDQTTGSQNGIYVVAAGAWTRSLDANSSTNVKAGFAVWVNEGTTQGDTAWALTTDDPIVVDTTSLSFTAFSTTAILPGTGITKTGNTIAIDQSFSPTWTGTHTFNIAPKFNTITLGSVLFAGTAGVVSQDNAAFFWDATNKRLKITQSATDPLDGAGTITLRNTNAGGNASIYFQNAAGSFVGTEGWDNGSARLRMYAGTSVPYSIYTNNGAFGWDFSADGAIQVPSGGSSAVSAASTGRFRYNSTGQKFQASLSGAGYGDVLAGNGLTFSPSNIRIGIGTAASTPGFALDIRDATTGGECISVRSLSSSGYSDLVWFDSSNVQKGGVGWANSGVGVSLASKNFFYTPNIDWIMSDGTTDFFRWYVATSAIGFEFAAGNSATVSAANKGKIRYNSSSQLFQSSYNGGAYVDNVVGSLTATRIPFASAAGILADDAGLVWDNTAKSVLIKNDGVGVTQDEAFKLYNTTAATVGVQQYSPMATWRGEQWRTDLAATRTMEGSIQLQTYAAGVLSGELSHYFRDGATGPWAYIGGFGYFGNPYIYLQNDTEGSYLQQQISPASGIEIYGNRVFSFSSHDIAATLPSFSFSQDDDAISTRFFQLYPPRVTGVTVEYRDFDLANTQPVNFNGTGGITVADQRQIYFKHRAYGVTTGTATLTRAATIAISGAPTANAGVTITNAYALLVEAGAIRLNEAIEIGNSSAAVSPASTGRFRYNSTAQHLEASENGGAYQRVVLGDKVSVSDSLLTTTGATTVATFTPSVQGNHKVFIYYRVVTGTTNLSLSVTYTDGSGAQTETILSVAAQAVGSYVVPLVFINATAAAISVSATAGTANRVYVSATIESA